MRYIELYLILQEKDSTGFTRLNSIAKEFKKHVTEEEFIDVGLIGLLDFYIKNYEELQDALPK